MHGRRITADTGSRPTRANPATRLHLGLLVDPARLGARPVLDLAVLEPESDLLLGVLDAVGAVADVAADINGEVTTDGAGEGGKGVGSTEEGYFECQLGLP